VCTSCDDILQKAAVSDNACVCVCDQHQSLCNLFCTDLYICVCACDSDCMCVSVHRWCSTCRAVVDVDMLRVLITCYYRH